MRGLVFLALSACSFPVTVDRPEITIDCIVVDLPTGNVRYCDAGTPADASEASTAVIPSVSPATSGGFLNANGNSDFGAPIGCLAAPCPGPKAQ